MTIAEAQRRVDQWIKSYGVRYFNGLTKQPYFIHTFHKDSAQRTH